MRSDLVDAGAPSSAALRAATPGFVPGGRFSPASGRSAGTAGTAILQLSVLGIGLIALTAAGLALHRPGAITLPSLSVTWVFVGLLAVAAALYFFAVALILRRPMPATTVWLVLGVAVALRVVVLPAPPFLSSDVFRYVWDGQVQNAGFNPYRYVPADPALSSLRDDTIYPHVNRAGYARTIYPPMAQLVFRAIAAISPSVLAMKAAAVGFELLAMAAIITLLSSVELPRERVLIYAWNPLAVWAFAGNGHVDAIAVGLIGVVLLARLRRSDAVVGAVLGAAILVKFLPAAMAPALWRRRDWRMPVVCIATMLALYGCYISAGWHVLGFLPGYAVEEGFGRGAGLWLMAGIGNVLPLSPMATSIYLVVAVGVFVACAAWVAFRSQPGAGSHHDIVQVAGDAAGLAAIVMVLLSPHYAWYYPWLALPCCICPLRSVIYLSAAGLLLYVNPLDEHFLWPCLLFVPAIALAVRDRRILRSI